MVGISMGGDVALDLTLAHPECVSRLVLVSTLAAMEEPSDELRANWSEAESAFERGELDRATEVEVEGWVIGAGRTRNEVNEQYRAQAARMIGKIWNRASSHPPDIEEIELDPPRKGRLSEVSVPTLLIRGDHDFPDVPLSIDRLHAEIPGATMTIIPNSAHLPPLEQPEVFNQTLADFLAQ